MLPGAWGRGTVVATMDPFDASTVYLATSGEGLWKTTDCGSTWAHLDTGRSSGLIDCSDTGSLLADPVVRGVLYATPRPCIGSGVSKSTNGGVDWDQLWPGSDAGSLPNDYAQRLSMDPTDNRHLLLTFGKPCTGAYAPGCIAETKDGGATWRYVRGDAAWTGYGSSRAWIVVGAHWLYSSEGEGFWYTLDSGASWHLIDAALGTKRGDLYHARTGLYYVATSKGIARSPDGIAWSLIPNSGQFINGLTGDGTTIYASTFGVCFDWGSPVQPYTTSPEADGLTWTPFATPPSFNQGGTIALDPGRHLLYTARCQGGLWRVVTP
jgi:hypothetical protein